MSSNLESVVFEIQVDKGILEQLLIDNENFKDCYDKLLKQDIVIKQLNDELLHCRTINKQLTEKNLQLEQQNGELQQFKTLYNQCCTKDAINNTDAGLLKMKLRKLEDENRKLLQDFDKQNNQFNRTLIEMQKLNNNKLIINELLVKTTQLQDELTKKQLDFNSLINKYNQLDIVNVNLEKANKQLNKQLLLIRQKLNLRDLSQHEYNLIKLKLQKLENDKESLLTNYQKEIAIIKQNQEKKSTLLSSTTIKTIEDNMQLLKKWFKNELKQSSSKCNDRDTDADGDLKLLKDKIRILEDDKKNLIDGFEMEREIFRRILKENKPN